MIGNLWPGDFLCHCGKLKQSLGVPGDNLFLLSFFPAALMLLWDQLYFLHHLGSVSRNAFLLGREKNPPSLKTMVILQFHLSRVVNQANQEILHRKLWSNRNLIFMAIKHRDENEQ